MTEATTDRVPRPADLDRRLHAFVVDRGVAWTVAAAPAYPAVRHLVLRGHPVLGLVVIVAAASAVGAVLAVVLGLTGTSPGRAATGLRLVDARTGAPIGAGRALRRQLLLAVATVPTLGLGTAALARTAMSDPGGRRHGWHDRVVGSEVVDVRLSRVERAEQAEQAEPASDRAGPLVNLTALRLVPVPPTVPLIAPPPVPPCSSHPSEPSDPPPAGPAAARWRVAFDTGETVVVDGPVLLGRDPEARPGEQAPRLLALSSSDLSLSKTHARLALDAQGALVVADRGSTNGTVLLRRGAARDLPAGRPTTLLDGDLVRIGDREMQVGREPRPGTRMGP